MKRFLRIALVVLAVLGFTGFFAFSTFLFNPFEGSYAPDVSTLVPREVDLFVAKAGLVDDFDAELGLRGAEALAAGPFGALVDEPAAAELVARYDEVRAAVREQLARLPVAAHPLAVFGGGDLGLAAYFDRPVEGGIEWVVLGRVNWVAKLAYAALESPGLFGLEAQGLSASEDEGVVTLSGGELEAPLYLTRIRDVVVISNGAELPAAARGFERNRAENSFGMSARYHDQVLARAGDEDVEVFVRSDRLPDLLGLEGPFPDPASQDFLEALAGRFVSLAAVGEMAGALGIDADLVSLSLHGEWNGDALTGDQKRIYRRKATDQRQVVERLGRLATADAGLAFYVETDLGDLLRLAVRSAERALVDNLETEVVQPIFGYATIDPLISDLEAAFRDRVAVIVRPNRYSDTRGTDPPNDGRAALAWAIALWVEDPTLLYDPEPGKTALLQRMEDARNAPRLGLEGANGEPGIYRNEDRGFRLTEYWSPLVPGTGHVATGVAQDVFVVTNHWRMVGELFQALSGSGEVPALADRPEFTAMMGSGLPSVSAVLWLDPGSMGDDLGAVLRQRAEDDVYSEIDWDVERPRIEKRMLAQHFPGEVWGNLSSPVVEEELEVYVLDEVERFRQQFKAERLPALVERIDARLGYLDGLERALFAVKFDTKDFDLDARLVIEPTR